MVGMGAEPELPHIRTSFASMKTPLILFATISLMTGCGMINVTPYDPVVADREDRDCPRGRR